MASNAVVGVRVRATLGGDQRALMLAAMGAQVGVVVGRVAQHEDVLKVWRERIEQRWGLLVVGGIGWVTSAAKGSQTSATVTTTCSLQP